LRNIEIAILTGPINAGKTTSLQSVLNGLDLGSVSGFLTVRDSENDKHLLDIKANISIPFYTFALDPESIPVGRFYLSHNAITKGIEIIKNFAINEDSILVIDEVGKLELKGKGFDNALTQTLGIIPSTPFNKKILIIVRDYLVDDVLSHYKFKATIFHFKHDVIALETWLKK
jgi:nucleoside-triphosphatase THEP1